MILRGDCCGSTSLSFSSSILRSGFGSVWRVSVSVRVSVVGIVTSIICTAANFSKMLREVRPGASARSLRSRVTCRQ